jgi:hypothetical protein
MSPLSLSTGQSSSQTNTSSARLQGRWLLAARVAWIVLVLFVLGVAIASLPAVFAVLHQSCTFGSVDCNGSGLLTASQIQELPKYGFSLDAHAWMYLGIGGFYALVSIVLGAVIFWRKSDDWMALLVALLSISTGAVGISGPLQYSSSFWVVLENAVLLIESLAILYTLALFPNGRFVPRWSSWVALIYPVYTVCYLIFMFLLHLPAGTLFNNPVNAVAWFGSLIVLTLAQLYRYFRVSTPVERQQTKWFAFSFFVVVVVSTVVLLIAPTLLSIQHNGFLDVLILNGGPILFLLLPLSIGLAILRYRLWDIDAIINKALVYGLLSALLAAIYVGLILGLQALLGGLLHQTSAIALVVSTLAIFALFQPLHHRIQAVIDRRFYRRKYDAEKILAAFSATLRQEVDLDQLREQLLAVVQETMQPAHVSLWLRPPAPPGIQWVSRRANPSFPSEDEAREER